MGNRLFAYMIIIPVIFIIFIEGGISHAKSVRPAAVAGSFYSSTSYQLRKTIRTLLDNAPVYSTEGEIVTAVAPHAGYVYSGSIAASTYKQLTNVDFDTLIIIGHDSYRDTVAYTCPVDYFRTPLGDVPVDREMIDKMHAFNRGIKSNQTIHSDDHTIEIQLPFLQVMGKNCKIVPILFGNPTIKNCRILADAILSAAGDKKVFVLASTDMSHYPSYESANKVDKSTLEELKGMDIEAFFRHLKKQERLSVPGLQTVMCARGGVGTAILFAKALGANQARILQYANSGDVSFGDKNRVVGYSSVLFIKPY